MSTHLQTYKPVRIRMQAHMHTCTHARMDIRPTCMHTHKHTHAIGQGLFDVMNNDHQGRPVLYSWEPWSRPYCWSLSRHPSSSIRLCVSSCPPALLPSCPPTLLPSCPPTLLPCYRPTLLPCYSATLLPCHPAALLPSYPITHLPYYPPILTPSNPAALLPYYPAALLPC